MLKNLQRKITAFLTCLPVGMVFAFCLFIPVYSQTAYLARLNSNSTTYSSLQAAYDAAANNDIIQAQSGYFSGNVTFNRAISVTLKGGYNSDFSNSNGTPAIIAGSVRNTMGTVKLDNVVVSGGDDNCVFVGGSTVTVTGPAQAQAVYPGDSAQVTITLDPNAPGGVKFRVSVDGTIIQDWSTQTTVPVTAGAIGEHSLKVEALHPKGVDTYIKSFYIFRQPVKPE